MMLEKGEREEKKRIDWEGKDFEGFPESKGSASLGLRFRNAHKKEEMREDKRVG